MDETERKVYAQLVKQTSEVETLDSRGHVYKGLHVWTDKAPAAKADPSLYLFAKCLVLPGSTKDTLKLREIDPPTKEEFTIAKSHAFNYNDSVDPLLVPDAGMIPHPNVPNVLDFFRRRFLHSMIYSMAEPLLISINPYENLRNTGINTISNYRDAEYVADLPPHVFTLARKAHDNLHGVHKSQTIIVSGESGSGKTEATKHIMRYFAAKKGREGDMRIQEAVLAANPVLEAFGNAKTSRNDNSSRFGRFMQLEVGKEGGIFSGQVKNFLLEKSRVIFQAEVERSYHIFYQLVQGADSELRSRLRLRSVSEYKCLNPLCTSVDSINDAEDFRQLCTGLESMGIPSYLRESVFSILSGILLLGNVTFEPIQKNGLFDAAHMDADNLETLEEACRFLCLNPDDLKEALLVKISKAGNTVVRGSLKIGEAQVRCQSLAKGVYEKLFDWVVRRLNATISPNIPSNTFMGMLDIFGFEVFQNNSLEQLFINVTNEMLQKCFLQIVFEKETALYRSEGITFDDIHWTSNSDIIDALTGRHSRSVLTLLEDACLGPASTDALFVQAITKRCPNDIVRPAKIGGESTFIVRHTIGDISYEKAKFLSKNKDVLGHELAEIVKASHDPVTSSLLSGVITKPGQLGKGQLIGSQFAASLDDLIQLINTTEPHFIRCVKPNETKSPKLFASGKILVQIHALSVLEALQLRQNFYTYRRPFSEFLQQFRYCNLAVAENTNMPGSEAAAALFRSVKVTTGFRIGRTVVFMKGDTLKKMMQKQRDALEKWTPLIELIETHYIKSTLAARLKELEPSIVRVQAHCRRQLTAMNRPVSLISIV